jgi:hypothetical protein
MALSPPDADEPRAWDVLYDSEIDLLLELGDPPLPQPTISRTKLGYRPVDDSVVDALAGALGVREPLLQRPRVIRSRQPVLVRLPHGAHLRCR